MLFSRKFKHDVFISHAVLDKLTIANEICDRLEKEGIDVWYSGARLRVGDSIEGVIRKNFLLCRYAVVIFSQNYLSNDWTMKELHWLQTQETPTRKVILPVLYDVTVEDLKGRDLLMADRYAIPHEKGMDHVIHKLLEQIQGTEPVKVKKPIDRKKIKKYAVRSLAALALVFVVSLLIYTFYNYTTAPNHDLIEQTIRDRITSEQQRIDKTFKQYIQDTKASTASQTDISSLFNKFSAIKSYYRNEYEFISGFSEYRFKKNVEDVLSVSMDKLAPNNAYGLNMYNAVLSPVQNNGLIDLASFAFINQLPLEYSITNAEKLDNGDYVVNVTYKNNIRSIIVNLIFPTANIPKRYQVSLSGFLPVEQYTFRQKDGSWTSI